MYWPHDPNHPVTKVCTRCGEEKPFPEFHLDYRRGRCRAECRACCRARLRRYYAANAERCRSAKRRYYAANREGCRAAKRERYATDGAKRRAAQRQYRAANPEKHRADARRSRRRNPERVRDRRRADRQRHPRKVLVRQATGLLRKLGLIELAEQCEDCGRMDTEHHHTDYRDPFAVMSLCHRCHMRRHFAVWRRTGGGPVKYPQEYGGGGGEECGSGGMG